MNLLPNAGDRRAADVLRAALRDGPGGVDLLAAGVSLFGFAAVADALSGVPGRLAVPGGLTGGGGSELLGGPHDRTARNALTRRHLARRFHGWVADAEVREQTGPAALSVAVVRDAAGEPAYAVQGASLTTGGLGLTPAAGPGLVQETTIPEEAAALAGWFEGVWNALPAGDAKARLSDRLRVLADHSDPAAVYATVLSRVLGGGDAGLDEDRVVRGATGIRDTAVWKALYKFQKDAAVGAVEKLNAFGGCILADSVGLGKTFEALAVVKYHELRNDRVLVLCPKRLRDNWAFFASNDRRNPLSADRFNYDVLHHTDLSRDGGKTGDVDLATLNWGNYDLVVIDESHNFRNKTSPERGRETRYDRLMRRVIKEGVRTRVLMLSATPVNNRLADLKNQIAFATEGRDDALEAEGVSSIDATCRRAQAVFNDWRESPAAARDPADLVARLGFDYFRLLDRLTIARSRRHVEKYYGTAETGRFPDRLPPANVKSNVDTEGDFEPIGEHAATIQALHLAAFKPISYVLPAKRADYEAKYGTELTGGRGVWKQADREEGLVNLMRVNVLKRLESSVEAFRLTVGRQLADVEALLSRLDELEAGRGEAAEFAAGDPDITEVDPDDPAAETLLVGRKVKVLLSDVDPIRWRQDLSEDREKLAAMHAAAVAVTPGRDAKLADLKDRLRAKVEDPLNPGNTKALIFTAFADTARYLYEHLHRWAAELGLTSAVVTGAGGNRSTLPGLSKDFGAILTAFAPRAKGRPAEFAGEGEVDLLIATDCISEGQNLQDCDWLANYDIHWNPVRIIQRFGRIDRLGSPNDRIQLVNFWPNMELEAYIDLENRVSGRMVLLDVSATGEENLLTASSGDPMRDLDYRKAQLLKMKDAVPELEDLSAGVSIADLTLNDFRVDLAEALKADPVAAGVPRGSSAVATAAGAGVPPGVLFCLERATGAASGGAAGEDRAGEHVLVHVADDGTVHLPHGRVRDLLDLTRRLCHGRDRDAAAEARFDRATRDGAEMARVRTLLAAACRAAAGVEEEQAVKSLFRPGGTTAGGGESTVDDFEVAAFVVVLPDDAEG